jgi:tetratricopeptide (TPR) repeat protein
MSTISSTLLARFARLPRMATEVWQGGLIRLPSWVEGGQGGKPYRPWAAFWMSLRTGRVHLDLQPEGGGRDPALALTALLEFGLNRKLAGCRPWRVEVIDEETAAYLARELGDQGLSISVAKDLTEIKHVLDHMAEDMSGTPLPPGAMDAPGVTVERMCAFAAAAKDFYTAAPWRMLTGEDLIQVEAPAVEAGLRYLTILGGGGFTFGLGFYEKPEEFEAVLEAPEPETLLEGPGRWSMLYGPISEMPFGDVDLWEEHGLPIAGEEAYPVAMHLGSDGGIRRPDARMLADLEGLLLALATTSEEEIDRGRWTHEVQTYDGQKTVTLCIPALLEPLDAPPKMVPGRIPDRRIAERALVEIQRFMAESDFHDLDEANAAIQSRFSGSIDELPATATTPLEKAQDLAYRASEAQGRRKIQLARKALELSPDCADAYVVLAEEAADPETARNLYEQGVAAGERALGPKTFEEEGGNFWGLVTTRPYMRARLGLAQCLEESGRIDEAIGHYRELLRLNPNDNQGVRDILLPTLLAEGRDADAGALLQQYADDVSATWKYGWALWTFRQEGDSQLARNRLREAVRANRHVPRHLSGKAEMPDILPDAYALGSVEEAIFCADDLGEAWLATPGAERWLATAKPRTKPKKHRRR